MKGNKKKYAESVLQEVCYQLDIEVPELVDSGVVINPGSKTTGSIIDNIERSYNEGRSTNLGKISDLVRCTVIAEDYAQTTDYIKKLSKQVQCVTGSIKRQPRSGYMGVNIHLKSDELPSEIQFGTPEWYRAKKVDDVNYLNTRLYFSLCQKLAMGQLSEEEREILNEQQDDYAIRCALGRKLYESLYDSIDFHENIRDIEKHLNFLNRTAGKKDNGKGEHYDILNNWSFINSKGKVDKNSILSAVNKIRPNLDIAQEKLCANAVAPIRGGKIINDHEL